MLSWLNRDAKLILLAKSGRNLSFGAIGVILGIYLSRLGLSAASIGFALTLIVATTALSTVFTSLVADRAGRRHSLEAFTILTTVSGTLLLYSSDPAIIVLAAILGNVSLALTEAGPLPSIEQAIIPSCCSENRRNSLFSLYNFVGYGASSLGSLSTGIPDWFPTTSVHEGFRPLFLIYVATAIMGLLAYSRISGGVEVPSGQVIRRSRLRPESKPIVARLALLFSLDAFAGGFVIQSIISYWFYLRFHAALSEIGAIFFITQVITALSLLLAARIASWAGLLNTMVFTHIPSNLLLMAIPFAPSIGAATILLWVRHSLSQMDVPTRQSYLVAVVDSSDRTAAVGLTNVTRMVSQSLSPSVGGYAIQFLGLGIPFFLGGSLKIVYDLLLYASFKKIKPPEEKGRQRLLGS